MKKILLTAGLVTAVLSLQSCMYDAGPDMDAAPPPVEAVSPYGTITMTNATAQPMLVTYNHWHEGNFIEQHVANFGPNQSKTFQLSSANTTFRIVRVEVSGQNYPLGQNCNANLEPEQSNATIVLNPLNTADNGQICFVNYS